jgi:hypothetical protein
MNVVDALHSLRQGNTLVTKDWVGWFNMIENYIHFSCPGDYPCCHDSFTIDEFLDAYGDCDFTIKN